MKLDADFFYISEHGSFESLELFGVSSVLEKLDLIINKLTAPKVSNDAFTMLWPDKKKGC